MRLFEWLVLAFLGVIIIIACTAQSNLQRLAITAVEPVVVTRVVYQDSVVAPIQNLQQTNPTAVGLRCSTIRPESEIGGSWAYSGSNMFRLNSGTYTIRGAVGWTVHTPAYPGNPGLPAGSQETTDVATAYHMSCVP